MVSLSVLQYYGFDSTLALVKGAKEPNIKILKYYCFKFLRSKFQLRQLKELLKGFGCYVLHCLLKFKKVRDVVPKCVQYLWWYYVSTFEIVQNLAFFHTI